MIACCLHGRAALASGRAAVQSDWNYVAQKMRGAGIKNDFAQALRRAYEPGDFATVAELNSLLFLRKTDDHTPQVSKQAVLDVRQFMRAHKQAFFAAEKKYGVSRSVVAALLWLESRYGNNAGRFHVASVFLSLAQVDQPQVILHLRGQAAPRFTPRLTSAQSDKVERKARDKAKWALQELKALQQMYERDRQLTLSLRGSFAGAFGMPQFIPSSYVTYARASSTGKRAADLTRADDAIHSVAHYLKVSGWRQARRPSHEKALLKYNNSRDYARAILQLADLAENQKARLPAAATKTKRRRGKKR